MQKPERRQIGEVLTNIGIIHDEGHPEPWIIAKLFRRFYKLIGGEPV